MQVRYQDRYPRYECSHSRADHVAAPLCGSVRADTIDEAVTAALGVKEAAHVLRIVLQARQKGIAVIFITHNVVHALTVGDDDAKLRLSSSTTIHYSTAFTVK